MTSQPTSRRNPLRVLIALLAAVLMPFALVGAASMPEHHHPHPMTWNVWVGNESPDHAIQGMSFLPKNIYIDAHDTIHWVANGAEIHTVTFLMKGQKLEPFDPSNPQDLLPQGKSWYDGHSYYNSGVLSDVSNSGFPAGTSYSLTFPRPGTFTYYCLVHGRAMVGTVHVAHRGAPYPYTQAQYDSWSAKRAAWILRDGYRLWHETAEHANRHTVYEGADDGIAMVMRFIWPTVAIHRGQRVTFKNVGMAAPHTVTFGQEPKDIFTPSGDPSNYWGGPLNSGLQTPGSTFTVRFRAAGVFTYVCALHDYMGMTGKVIVKH